MAGGLANLCHHSVQCETSRDARSCRLSASIPGVAAGGDRSPENRTVIKGTRHDHVQIIFYSLHPISDHVSSPCLCLLSLMRVMSVICFYLQEKLLGPP